MKPTLNSDNCPPANGQYPPAKEEGRMSSLAFPKLADKYDDTNTLVIGHTGQFEPGTYEVDYSLRDSEGNVYPHECKMHIEVELDRTQIGTIVVTPFVLIRMRGRER